MDTYSESAEGIDITVDRALQEVRRHGHTSKADTRSFMRECWTVHAEGRFPHRTIPAEKVLNWLGY